MKSAVKDSPQVSVILPCYNEERWVSGAIESVINQDYDDFELIVIDDGSTDETAKIIKSFDDSRIQYIYQRNRGNAGARNKGLDEASAEFYAFIDADDRWYQNKLKHQISALESSNADMVHANARYIDEKNASIGKYHKESPPNINDKKEFVKELFSNNFICTSSVLCYHSAINDLRFDEALYANSDHDMWLRLAENNQISFINEILLDYRIHGGNISKNYDKLFEDRKRVFRKARKRNNFSKGIVDRRRSNIHLTYGVNLALDRRAKRSRSVLKEAMKYDWTNWKIYPTYLLTFGGRRFLKSLSKAGKNY